MHVNKTIAQLKRGDIFKIIGLSGTYRLVYNTPSGSMVSSIATKPVDFNGTHFEVATFTGIVSGGTEVEVVS